MSKGLAGSKGWFDKLTMSGYAKVSTRGEGTSGCRRWGFAKDYQWQRDRAGFKPAPTGERLLRNRHSGESWNPEGFDSSGAALEGVRVLDLGRGISAPYCARLLADQGADVLKVEAPPQGDPARRTGPFPQDEPHPEKSGLYLHLNMNKRGVTLDLESSGGAAILRKLVGAADLVVENFPPSYLPSNGLGYEALREVNPRLVMVSITPFGQTGPYRDYLASEIGVFAMTGRMYTHGVADEEPLRYAPDISWFQAGATAAVPAVAALLMAQAAGSGQHVDVSAMEAMAGNVDNRPLYYGYSGMKSERGNWPGGYPQGAYPCSDGYVVFGVGFDRFFPRLCRAMGMPELGDDPRFATLGARMDNLDEFEPIFLGWMLQHTRQEVFRVCQEARVLCSPILGPGELMEDPQMEARGYFRDVEHPQAGTLTYPGPAFRMAGSPSRWRPAPLLGQHNHEVYCGELGYSRDDLARLRYAGVV